MRSRTSLQVRLVLRMGRDGRGTWKSWQLGRLGATATASPGAACTAKVLRGFVSGLKLWVWAHFQRRTALLCAHLWQLIVVTLPGMPAACWLPYTHTRHTDKQTLAPSPALPLRPAAHFQNQRPPKVLVTTCFKPSKVMYTFLSEMLVSFVWERAGANSLWDCFTAAWSTREGLG